VVRIAYNAKIKKKNTSYMEKASMAFTGSNVR
jgi:hypothetical protein